MKDWKRVDELMRAKLSLTQAAAELLCKPDGQLTALYEALHVAQDLVCQALKARL